MFGVSLPVSRPAGRALLVVHQSSQSGPMESLSGQGFQCATREDPYAAMAELARRPLAYRAVVLSLQSLYREELAFIPAIKRRWPHLDVWLTHTDGRAATLAEAMRLGADGLLAEDGHLHRTAAPGPAPTIVSAEQFAPLPPLRPSEDVAPPPAAPEASAAAMEEPFIDEATGEPVLTAEELRALLQDPPPATLPSATGNDDVP